VESVKQFDLAVTPLREINRFLHREAVGAGVRHVQISNADGAHSIAAGVNAPLDIEVDGHAGYYLGGMNQHASITVHGNAGPGVGENMMSGTIRVAGFASTAAGASAHGGTLVIHGDAALRCGISLKGGDIVVCGGVGSFSAFMAQAGRIVICGDAGDALGDSLYEAVIYVRGNVRSLGADARFEPMDTADFEAVRELLERARLKHDHRGFKRVASARSLYHWNADANQQY
jgi:glutamate synthase domain-containing protein 3